MIEYGDQVLCCVVVDVCVFGFFGFCFGGLWERVFKMTL